jgi:short chain dehydrogenase
MRMPRRNTSYARRRTSGAFATITSVIHRANDALGNGSRKVLTMSKLNGKIAVITGGSSGIGLATAQRFVEEGAYVFITGRRQSELEKAKSLIGRNVTTVQGDVANLDDLDRVTRLSPRKKGLSILSSPMPVSSSIGPSKRRRRNTSTRPSTSMLAAHSSPFRGPCL